MSARMRAPWLPPKTRSRSGAIERGVGRGRRGNDSRPYRIAGHGRLRRERGLVAKNIGKGGADRGDAWRQQPVGPADDGIGIVDQARYAPPHARQHRRQRRIAAEADDGRRLQSADQRPGLDKAKAEHRGGARHLERTAAAQRRAGDDMDGVVGEGAAIARRALVGGEMNGDAALKQRRRQRLGRKQMAAGAAGGEQHRPPPRRSVDHARLPAATMRSSASRAVGRSRVSAISMPMP